MLWQWSLEFTFVWEPARVLPDELASCDDDSSLNDGWVWFMGIFPWRLLLAMWWLFAESCGNINGIGTVGLKPLPISLGMLSTKSHALTGVRGFGGQSMAGEGGLDADVGYAEYAAVTAGTEMHSEPVLDSELLIENASWS